MKTLLVMMLAAVSLGAVSLVEGPPRPVVAWEEELRGVAALELSCDSEDLEVAPLAGNSAAVSGCGGHARYARTEDAWLRSAPARSR